MVIAGGWAGEETYPMDPPADHYWSSCQKYPASGAAWEAGARAQRLRQVHTRYETVSVTGQSSLALALFQTVQK